MKRLLENKVALVAGSGTGIGRASALALSNAGAKVVVSKRPGREDPWPVPQPAAHSS